MRVSYLPLTLASAVVLMTGCGGNKLDVTQFMDTPADKARIEIPDACKSAYENSIPMVAVVDFTNNSTFGKAELSSTKGESTTTGTSTTTSGGVNLGIVHAEKSQTDSKSKTVSSSETAKRSVDAKVGQSVTDAVESQIVELGGARIFSRTNLEKIMAEQKLQQSGLMSDDTLVELGKVAGVKYIVTGAINNVKQKYVAKMETMDNGDTGNDTLNTLSTLGNLAIIASNVALSGMTVETEMTIKIIDVETAEVLFSKQITGTTSIGDFPNATFDQLVGGLKGAATEALKQADAELTKYFKVRGYVVKLKSKGDERIAMINIGDNMGIKEGQEFYVYGFDEVVDPMSGKTSCDMTMLPISLSASDQIQKDKTWTTVEGDNKAMVRIGQLVERKPVER